MVGEVTGIHPELRVSHREAPGHPELTWELRRSWAYSNGLSWVNEGLPIGIHGIHGYHDATLVGWDDH